MPNTPASFLKWSGTIFPLATALSQRASLFRVARVAKGVRYIPRQFGNLSGQTTTFAASLDTGPSSAEIIPTCSREIFMRSNAATSRAGPRKNLGAWGSTSWKHTLLTVQCRIFECGRKFKLVMIRGADSVKLPRSKKIQTKAAALSSPMHIPLFCYKTSPVNLTYYLYFLFTMIKLGSTLHISGFH